MTPGAILGGTASQRVFEQTHSIWIAPELLRRGARGELPPNFQISRCLILLPSQKTPIVQFNEEVSWEGIAKLAGSTQLGPGQGVYLSQVEKVETVKPPEVDGKRVAFIYLYLVGRVWNLVFDATPNLPAVHDKDHSSEDWEIGRVIAESLNQNLADRVIAFHEAVKDSTLAIGLWAVPSLEKS